ACAHLGLAGAASRAAESDLTARAIGGAIRQTGASLDAARDGDAIGAGAGLGQPATVDADLVRDCAGSSGGDACACHEPIVSPAPFKSPASPSNARTGPAGGPALMCTSDAPRKLYRQRHRARGAPSATLGPWPTGRSAGREIARGAGRALRVPPGRRRLLARVISR